MPISSKALWINDWPVCKGLEEMERPQTLRLSSSAYLYLSSLNFTCTSEVLPSQTHVPMNFVLQLASGRIVVSLLFPS